MEHTIQDHTPILDVRPRDAFLACRHPAAVNIPLESLLDRMHELPAPDLPLVVFDACRVRARWAASRLRARSRMSVTPRFGDDWLAQFGTARGPTDRRLWSAHELLMGLGLAALRDAWGTLDGRNAVDLACGSGRDAITLAEAGMAVEAWDHFDAALERVGGLARQCGVSIATRNVDIENNAGLLPGSFDCVVCFNFLHRPLFDAIKRAVRPGGFVIYETFTVEQRERFGKPRRDSHLLMPNELREIFGDWRLIHYSEGLAAPRRFVASIIARKVDHMHE